MHMFWVQTVLRSGLVYMCSVTVAIHRRDPQIIDSSLPLPLLQNDSAPQFSVGSRKTRQNRRTGPAGQPLCLQYPTIISREDTLDKKMDTWESTICVTVNMTGINFYKLFADCVERTPQQTLIPEKQLFCWVQNYSSLTCIYRYTSTGYKYKMTACASK